MRMGNVEHAANCKTNKLIISSTQPNPIEEGKVNIYSELDVDGIRENWEKLKNQCPFTAADKIGKMFSDLKL